MNYNFFALISRMKYIDRWALMRNTRQENLCEHSMEVAMIAHALCTIGNVRYGKHLDANKAALIGLYHDASEIITGDMPTPVKYFNSELKHAYKEVEALADSKLLDKLPDDMRPIYEDIFIPGDTEEDKYIRKLVKAADKLSALIKCISEVNVGNAEFKTAKDSTGKSIRKLYQELPEVLDFVNEFLSSYGNTLDELT
ncbi:5'-deoxynucleotidase [Butyrivibrio sp. INlla14]|uniref:5'-deoxynucleotidase n=1 Tax=Butyrivibrio sp. INlla14 TaxID=1520808 RepID=UPI000876BE27|nr:5'-deoxynucleotidase [Butyrivibrio sp. INlla14]SCY08705.1 5'-deoxynucleotidase [Butyrivibrio sp. INlla14]